MIKKWLAFVLAVVSLLAFGMVGASAASDETLAKEYLSETKKLMDGDHTLRAVSYWEGEARSEQVFIKSGDSEIMYWPGQSRKLLRTVSVYLPDHVSAPMRTIYPGLRLYGNTSMGYSTSIWVHLDVVPAKPTVLRSGNQLKVTVPPNDGTYGPGDATFTYTNGVLTGYEYGSELSDFITKWDILELSTGADASAASTERMLNLPLFIKFMQFIQSPATYLLFMF